MNHDYNTDLFLELSLDARFVSPKRPERFIHTMKHNTGNIALFLPWGYENGLERHNPIISFLGDSVTAGHFHFVLSPEEIHANYLLLLDKDFEHANLNVEYTNVLMSYPDKFRQKLVEYFKHTSVNVLNAGIAGDSLKGMAARLERDVLQHKPDLIIINGSLNWNDSLGTTAEYDEILNNVIKKIKNTLDSDIILLTPNGISQGHDARKQLEERVNCIRNAAKQHDLCLADVYAVWEAYENAGYSWEPLLCNGMNHPAEIGHEVYANVLMNLIKGGAL